MKDKYKKENLEVVVNESYCIRDVCRRMDLKPTGGGWKTVKKYINIHNIDTSHFKPFYRENFTPIPLEDILKKDRYFSTTHLKNKLYKEGLKERKCELCGQDEEWNGKKMSLILDHINGINDDNRLENLRIVCPNCNATLETHCKGYSKIKKEKENKNKIECKLEKERERKVKIKCNNCNNLISNKSKTGICHECSSKKQRKVERPIYSTLMENIEELGYVGTGKKYGVSDNTIRKWKKFYEK